MSQTGEGGSGFLATHVVPPGGLPTWADPDPAHPSARLDPLLPVQLAELRGDWAQVRCSNGWSAWVDGRLLVALPHSPEAAARPLDVLEDPRPLLIRLERALAEYRRLVDELAAGRCDLESFRRRSAGVRLGAVVDGAAAWLLDLDQGSWYYCDGSRLRTYATVQPPPDGRDRGADSR
ncbi:hypothetical protein P3T37_000671 [Kitasatospora sp. MAA4]|uniref:hypothetical protein n=1 Tax=Kitasatospora sp. MAA4 TaxID=3035093 RepID=UPI00247678C7|nr:hypothetical protein [Kitasatospora sp. MAA4]MDH6131302.1 hypothetical protein [Kitasatospora sp. MAA4]